MAQPQKQNNTLLIVLLLGIGGAAIWFLFIRKKNGVTVQGQPLSTGGGSAQGQPILGTVPLSDIATFKTRIPRERSTQPISDRLRDLQLGFRNNAVMPVDSPAPDKGGTTTPLSLSGGQRSSGFSAPTNQLRLTGPMAGTSGGNTGSFSGFKSGSGGGMLG